MENTNFWKGFLKQAGAFKEMVTDNEPVAGDFSILGDQADHRKSNETETKTEIEEEL